MLQITDFNCHWRDGHRERNRLTQKDLDHRIQPHPPWGESCLWVFKWDLWTPYQSGVVWERRPEVESCPSSVLQLSPRYLGHPRSGTHTSQATCSCNDEGLDAAPQRASLNEDLFSCIYEQQAWHYGASRLISGDRRTVNKQRTRAVHQLGGEVIQRIMAAVSIRWIDFNYLISFNTDCIYLALFQSYQPLKLTAQVTFTHSFITLHRLTNILYNHF